jgi:hydroxyethylthiazole kinase-like sugar kinase family protein
MTQRSRWLILCLAAAGATGCSHEPSGPTAAALQVSLTSPNSDDGALFFSVTGGRVDSVQAPGYMLYTHRPDPNTLQVIVTGNLASGTVAQLWIPDERRAAQYTASVNQAAARRSYLQRDPGSYRLSLQE